MNPDTKEKLNLRQGCDRERPGGTTEKGGAWKSENVGERYICSDL